MYDSKSYKVRFPLYYEVERFHRSIKEDVESVDRLYNENLVALKRKKILDSKSDSFHEESYNQDVYEPALIDLKIANSDRLVRLLKDVFSKFETSLREIAIQISSADHVNKYKSKNKKNSYIKSYKLLIVEKTNIDLTSLEGIWNDIDALREDRKSYEHQGNNLIKRNEELKSEILDANYKIFNYLDNLMKSLNSLKE